uniref:(northern house mosquito) hypothetical protein n=1 Tax=Culex pipiens TaxID=7175 RepID=A0A8D8J8W2_CULPI
MHHRNRPIPARPSCRHPRPRPTARRYRQPAHPGGLPTARVPLPQARNLNRTRRRRRNPAASRRRAGPSERADEGISQRRTNREAREGNSYIWHQGGGSGTTPQGGQRRR